MSTCIFTRRPNEDKMKSIMSKHLVPENVPNMCVPRTNTEVWDLMNHGNQVADNVTQQVQLMQVHALSALLEIINAIGSNTAGPTEDHLATLTDATRLITMSFSSLTQVRKELVRNCLGYLVKKRVGLIKIYLYVLYSNIAYLISTNSCRDNYSFLEA